MGWAGGGTGLTSMWALRQSRGLWVARVDCFLIVGGGEADLVKDRVPLCKHAMGAIALTLKVWRLKMMVGGRGKRSFISVDQSLCNSYI